MKKLSTYDTVCMQISAHEPNQRLNGVDTPSGNAHHVHGCIFGIFEQN